jgi:L-ascorbate metabolism protein UlaG (beta-lactamase superfamily)
MKITFLGQAGLLFETDERKIIIDPYLSDSVSKIQPHNYRRVPVDESFLKTKVDIIPKYIRRLSYELI